MAEDNQEISTEQRAELTRKAIESSGNMKLSKEEMLARKQGRLSTLAAKMGIPFHGNGKNDCKSLF